MRTIALLLAWLVCGFAPAAAQTEIAPPPEQSSLSLVDVLFANGLVVSVPDDWLLFRREDYATNRDALNAWQANLDAVQPGFNLPPQLLDVTDLAALRPEQVDGRYVQLTVTFFALDEVANALSVAPADMTLAALAETNLYGGDWLEVEINGRPALVGLGARAPTVVPQAYVLFPDRRLAALVQLPVSEAYLDDLEEVLFALVMTLRAEGEAIDTDALEAFAAAYAGEPRPYPAAIRFPDPDAVVGVGGPATDCTVTAPQNANLRSGPGTNYTARGLLAAGSSVGVAGRAVGTDGFVWWQLHDGLWVRSDVVGRSAGCETLPVVPVP